MPNSTKTGLQEFSSAFVKLCAPCEFGYLKHFIGLDSPGTVIEPVQLYTTELVSANFSSKAIEEVIILNTEPGS